MKLIAILLTAFLASCAMSPPAKQVQLSNTLLALAKQADSLERAGVISNEQEDAIINKLILINQINAGTDTSTCATDKASCIDSLLSEAIKQLEAAQ